LSKSATVCLTLQRCWAKSGVERSADASAKRRVPSASRRQTAASSGADGELGPGCPSAAVRRGHSVPAGKAGELDRRAPPKDAGSRQRLPGHPGTAAPGSAPSAGRGRSEGRPGRAAGRRGRPREQTAERGARVARHPRKPRGRASSSGRTSRRARRFASGRSARDSGARLGRGGTGERNCCGTPWAGRVLPTARPRRRRSGREAEGRYRGRPFSLAQKIQQRPPPEKPARVIASRYRPSGRTSVQIRPGVGCASLVGTRRPGRTEEFRAVARRSVARAA
jgi:hypothetical protein